MGFPNLFFLFNVLLDREVPKLLESCGIVGPPNNNITIAITRWSLFFAKHGAITLWWVDGDACRWKHGINNGIKEPTHRYQDCDTNQILIFGGCVKVRETLKT